MRESGAYPLGEFLRYASPQTAPATEFYELQQVEADAFALAMLSELPVRIERADVRVAAIKFGTVAWE